MKLKALQQQAVQLRKDLNAEVKALRTALVAAQRAGKNADDIAKLVPGLKSLKEKVDEATTAQAADDEEAARYTKAKAGKNGQAALDAANARAGRIQTKIDALQKALAQVKQLKAAVEGSK